MDWLADHTTPSNFEEYAIIAHTHLLPNQVPLFKHYASLVGVNRIFVISKPYSTVHSAYLELVNSGIEVIPIKMKAGFPYSFCAKDPISVMWHKLLESRKYNSFDKLLILDDGGDLWTSIPWDQIGDLKITGVEQTQRGVSRIIESKMRLPSIVYVATSGIKKQIESHFIVKSCLLEIKKQIKLEGSKVGILGMGSIGRPIYDILKNENIQAYYYDPIQKSQDIFCMPSIDSLLQKCDIIIGATGVDVLHEVPFERVTGDKVLISLSSADVEFESILRFEPDRSSQSFDVVNIQVHSDLSFKILNGGYPINFNRKANATPDNEIVLTRCLLYIGMMQAKQILEAKDDTKSDFYNLETNSQEKLLRKWFVDYSLESQGFALDAETENIFKAKNPNFCNSSKSVWVDL